MQTRSNNKYITNLKLQGEVKEQFRVLQAGVGKKCLDDRGKKRQDESNLENMGIVELRILFASNFTTIQKDRKRSFAFATFIWTNRKFCKPQPFNKIIYFKTQI